MPLSYATSDMAFAYPNLRLHPYHGGCDYTLLFVYAEIHNLISLTFFTYTPT